MRCTERNYFINKTTNSDIHIIRETLTETLVHTDRSEATTFMKAYRGR